MILIVNDLMRIILTVFDTPILYPQTISVTIQKYKKTQKNICIKLGHYQRV